MLKFVRTATEVEFHYEIDHGGNEWVREELNKNGAVNISSVFYFEPTDLITVPPSSDDKISEFTYKFRFGVFKGDYVKILGRKLGIDNDVFIASDNELKRRLFAAERNISIFGRLADLLDHSNPIVIGGAREDAVPQSEFDELLEKFPNSYELSRYADARVSTILSQYLDGMKDARGRYENYLNKKSGGKTGATLELGFLNELEIEKYIIIRDLIQDALTNKTDMSEGEWQKLMLSFLLLLFPKYIKVLENVTINDYYTDPGKKRSRYIDIALIDANGNLDVIEIKKPFEDKILRKSQYRDNSIPTSELSGSIMQAEKYLFHLSKWGIKGERALTKKYTGDLPTGMSIRISNPKAIIIVGRDRLSGGQQALSESQMLDLEVIKRKYANMMDIITYDDLLRRLNNTIIALGGAS